MVNCEQTLDKNTQTNIISNQNNNYCQDNNRNNRFRYNDRNCDNNQQRGPQKNRISNKEEVWKLRSRQKRHQFFLSSDKELLIIIKDSWRTIN